MPSEQQHNVITPSESYKEKDFIFNSASKAQLSLDIVIIGCGLGGLAAAHCLTAAGHKITIIESAPQIGEVGAGIQVSPNVSRLLIRWGLGDRLEAEGVRPEGISFLRYATGDKVGHSTWGDDMESQHGAPYYHIHRADLHRMLFDLAAPQVKLRLGSTVVAVDPETPSLTLASGEVVKADLIIGADGVKSIVQTTVLGKTNEAQATGDAAYRAIVPTSVMLNDPELKPLVDRPEMTAWMAPGRHLMGYNIRGKQEYNLVLLHPDDGLGKESWTLQGDADKMREEYSDFEPRVCRLLENVKSTMRWRLMDRKPLDRWVHQSGKVVLLGDSCHPMLPYRAQGAAMAIEDAAVLGRLFSHVSRQSQVAPLLHAYESLRLPRTAATQASSRLNQHIFHLADGPDQVARDQAMRVAMEAEKNAAEGSTIGNPNQWADKEKNRVQFGYDADEIAEKWWTEEGQGLEYVAKL